ncbi:MAG: galactose-1-phosphate uridylyltransferase [Pseudomonadota bacterium]
MQILSPELSQFASAPDGRPLYLRRARKADGRDLLLYGFTPHEGLQAAEDFASGAGPSELRWHPLRQEWSIYAGARQNRPHLPGQADDPIAPGGPGQPLSEIPFSDFEIAIFENRFPTLSETATGFDTGATGIQRRAACGHCEVVVYTPDQTGNLTTLGQDRRLLLIHAWIERYADLFARGHSVVMPFENRGEAVGVTLHHPHGQLYAFDFVPPVQAKAADAFADGWSLETHLPDWWESYGIVEAGGMVAFAPPFARFPYEVWLTPRSRRDGPWAFSGEEIEGFAELLGEMTARYDRLFGRDMPYMLTLHAAPKGGSKGFHFTAQYYPLLRAAEKVKFLASIEQSTNVFTVDVLPEAAAAALKTA